VIDLSGEPGSKAHRWVSPWLQSLAGAAPRSGAGEGVAGTDEGVGEEHMG
jgi:hypothetical protein